jgi:hypothetical protein
MPRLSRWFIRTGIVYLGLSLLAGILQLVSSWGPLLWPTYVHLLVVGWLTQLIFGVAFWMFPRHSAQTPRGSEPLGWACFWLLNSGLLLRLVGEPGRALGLKTDALLLLSALLQLGAGMAFIVNTWPRIKER